MKPITPCLEISFSVEWGQDEDTAFGIVVSALYNQDYWQQYTCCR
ncbi:hypothetical protein [Vibrio harveyi]|nr:hypothetical protein [Vibrio harveyi]